MTTYAAVLVGFLAWCVIATVVGLGVGAAIRLRDQRSPKPPFPRVHADLERARRERGDWS